MTAESESPALPIDRYVGKYADRAKGMVPSEIRALFAVAARPEIVSLAGGTPYVAALPLDAVGSMVGELISTQGTTALQYCTAQGDAGLRERICEVMEPEGVQADPDDIVVTVGSQQALDLLSRIFIDPGDVVLAEAPSYVGALGAFAAYQANVVHVPMDDDGLIPEALEQAIAALTASGRRAKFLYTVPNFHNPAGVTLAEDRRHRILEICRRADLLIIEDNPYGLLGFDGDPMRALYPDDPDNVVYLGTFSKTFAAGVRVGWAVAPKPIKDKLVLAAESAVLCHSNFAQLTVREYLSTQPWREQIKEFRELYRERRDATLDALTREMPPGCSWTHPAGGFYVWLRFPDGINAKAMLPKAISARVAYVPGIGFYADGSGGQFARLCYAFPDPDRIREGVRRLASVVENELSTQTSLRTIVPRVGPSRRQAGPRIRFLYALFMTRRKSFGSDNHTGAHPAVLQAVLEANAGDAMPYGFDDWTAQAKAEMRSAFRGGEAFFVFNGSGANVLGLSALLRRHEAVICAGDAHIYSDECGAAERLTGSKLLPVDTLDGKLTPELIAPYLEGRGDDHRSQPGVLAITQSTELGTCYSLEELRKISDFAHASDLLVYLDGARLANAAAALGCDLADIAEHTDILSFGATKNGAIGGEALIVMRPDLIDAIKYLRKQQTQLASKMRFISAQFSALLHDDLWRANASHANAMAQRLAAGIQNLPGLSIAYPVQVNAVFAKLPPRHISTLQQSWTFHTWNETTSVVRWMTAFDTTPDDVDAFVSDIRKTCQE